GDLICGQCGEGNQPTRKFCRRCGSSLIEAEVMKAPWYKRLFIRKKRVVEAGERPMRGRRRRRSPISSLVRLVVLLGAVGLVVALIGPWRGELVGRVTGLFTSAKRTVLPDFDPVRPTGAEATSSAKDHPPAAAIDQIKNSYWAEGAQGDGTGQTLVLIFDQPANIDKVGFTAGASAKPEEFVAQPRPKDLHLVFSDGSTKDIRLEDSSEFQAFDVTAKAVARVEIHIVSVYGSLKGQDCSIAEVELYSKK
ncbi:MAG: NADase-type glycan-binding domain-containing protein, partial [Acidimicrobiia bacterium]